MNVRMCIAASTALLFAGALAGPETATAQATASGCNQADCASMATTTPHGGKGAEDGSGPNPVDPATSGSLRVGAWTPVTPIAPSRDRSRWRNRCVAIASDGRITEAERTDWNKLNCTQYL